MVSLKNIRASLPALKNHPGLVAVFLGGTSGIGEATVRAFAKYTTSATVYIVGRKAAAAEKIIADCSALSPSSKFDFIQQDVALLKDVDKVAQRIAEKEEKVDLLFMTPDYIDFGPRNETSEGIDTLLSLRYYTRIRLATSLLPLLSKSEAPRVISILAPYYCETPFHLDDLPLKTHYNILLNASHPSLMTTLAFEELSIRNPHISFLHVFPGSIWTPGVQVANISPLTKWLLNWVVKPLLWFWLQSYEECGDRMMFLLGSGMTPSREASAAGPEAGGASVQPGVLEVGDGQGVLVGSDGEVGSGCYCLDSGAKRLDNSSRLTKLRKKDAREKVWEHMMEVFAHIDPS